MIDIFRCGRNLIWICCFGHLPERKRQLGIVRYAEEPAPGKKEAFGLDLVDSWSIHGWGFASICSSSPPPGQVWDSDEGKLISFLRASWDSLAENANYGKLDFRFYFQS
ncbi:hypothetical protein IEQ34_004073 [Dendrobium chrysotoxum]|uniref:Uncharacterized protein n=1 Tax=Dendrobium chrysotoxum TaxID=161865 RepID=A0AAV7HHD8_DENCH|nr:hypothetical protein IEQ34_004073 [Dendrobium chrysotoxum]